mmetsp:Transcript_22210/g.68349  ORF Transcript_22210/g.68349 Transcript_22210/m.68349 type:complete len:102 (+) Transcript_22210:1302-1607(+)
MNAMGGGGEPASADNFTFLDDEPEAGGSSKAKAKKKKKKKKERRDAASSGSEDSDSDSGDSDAPRSAISGKRIKMSRERSAADEAEDYGRKQLLKLMNAQY